MASSMGVPISSASSGLPWSPSYPRLVPWAAFLCPSRLAVRKSLACFLFNAVLADLPNQDNQHMSIGAQDFLLRVLVSPW